jgi:drug/metabolite transporter (DMT)-like permease
VVLGLSGALLFGSADFVGGLAARRLGAVLTTAISAATGLLLLGTLVLIFPPQWSFAAVGWGALSGVCGSVAIMMLYAALAIGPMSILSPLGALVSAVVPVTFALCAGEALGPLGWIAIGVGLAAVVLVGAVPEKNAVRPSLKGLALGLGAGLFLGLFMICIDRVPSEAGLLPLATNRLVSTTIMFSIVGLSWVRRRRSTASRERFTRGLFLALLCGVVDALANALLLLGIYSGNLSVMSVLTALYPAGTILLASLLLRERISRTQMVGLVLAIAAAGMLALS